jgi:hypothetical protein
MVVDRAKSHCFSTCTGDVAPDAELKRCRSRGCAQSVLRSEYSTMHPHIILRAQIVAVSRASEWLEIPSTC